EVEVQAQDQQDINAFSRHTARLADLEEELEKAKTEKEYLEDLSTELELADEDEPVRYRVGDAFVHLTVEEAQVSLERDQAKWDARVTEHEAEIDGIHGDLSALKSRLYAKFGNAINLEK
ncbi:putative GIM3-Gim complex component, partial [Piptocephalis cylindrospora]